MIIDYSAHSSFDNCPAEWFEKYVNRRRKRWPKAQRDDALALGSLVHEGLRVWQLNHVVQVPNEVIEEIQPTKECLAAATELVYGYARAYPEEQWPLIHCETPLVFPLRGVSWSWACPKCAFPNRYGAGHGWPLFPDDCPGCHGPITRSQDGEVLEGLAKIDSYFYVPDYTTLRSGIDGIDLTLVPGWYIHEYKTKSSDIPIGLYMQSWEMNLQASYQMLALQSLMNTTRVVKPEEINGLAHSHEVQGVLVNVLEKPKKYVPKRKCRTCDASYEFYTWIPTGKGSYQCPVCGSRQDLQPLKESIGDRPASYYRILVTRSPEQLRLDRDEIILRGQQMLEMSEGGLRSKPWNHKNCVDFKWRKACDYFSPHKDNYSTHESEDYETPPDYRGLVQVDAP